MRRIHRHLQPSHLLVGPDFALGHGRQGNIEELRRMGDDFNFTLSIFDPVINDDEVISSSRIRSALAEGDMVKAQNLLGRPYRIDGAVIPGDRRGRSLGIPTANLDVWAERALPKTGVYACYAHVEDQTLLAVVNIGTRPTFDTQNIKQHVEAHLLHFNGNLYGKQLELDFITRIRNEQRFSSIEALVDQIHQDIHTAETLL
jgi:riboflavin kinase/FMN adenylyltransferase